MQIRTAFLSTASTFRLNRGPKVDGGLQGFALRTGSVDFGRNEIRHQSLLKDSELTRRFTFSQVDAEEVVWLAARKTTDALFLSPDGDRPGLALHRMPARCSSADSLGHRVRWAGVRAAALSAAFLVANRAALDMDLDPEEFDVLEPRLYGDVDARMPVLQLTDRLVNGAGFCKELESVDGGSPRVLRMIKSMLEDPEQYPLNKFLDSEEHGQCDTACYRCMLRYGNQPYHGLLDWRLGLTYLKVMTDRTFMCGLDGDFESFPGLTDWPEMAVALARQIAAKFNSPDGIKMMGRLPAFRLGSDREPRSPWVLVTHPLWDWSDKDGPLEGDLLCQAYEAVLKEEGPESRVLAWDTFNLARRQVLVREKIMNPDGHA